jgi:multiple sugar transport system substrate-binding protein
MMRRSRLALVAGTVVAALALSACSGGSSDKDSDSNTGKLEGTGPITFVSGKDTTGTFKTQLARWNSTHPNEKVTLIELPESADQQRQQLIQNAQTKSDAYTVLNLDVVWTAEFAANGWIEQLPEADIPLDKYLAPVVTTAKYFNKLYAAPYNTNGGLLFYRKDLLTAAGVMTPPKTWAEMEAACDKVKATAANKDLGCYAGQLQKYEGLTVNFSEAVNSAGGEIVDKDGKPNVDTTQAKKGLQFLVDGFKDGYIPKAAITYKEEEGRREFQDGKLIFQRQWPYQYSLANKTDGSSKVAGKFAVAPLPGLDGLGSSTLGGANLAISKYAKNKKTALEFIKFFTNEDNQKQNLEIASSAPVWAALYDDPALQAKYPYLVALKESVDNAKSRPAVVKYGDVTAAIQEQAYAALQGKKSVDQATKDLQASLSGLIK